MSLLTARTVLMTQRIERFDRHNAAIAIYQKFQVDWIQPQFAKQLEVFVMHGLPCSRYFLLSFLTFFRNIPTA